MGYTKSIVFSLVGLLAFSVVGNVDARESVRSVVTTEAVYRAGTPEVHEVQRWLLEHATHVKGKMVGDPGQLGDVKIVHTTSAPRFQIASPGDGPPVPLPPTGSPGESITISTTSGAITQSWTYTWQVTGGGTFGTWVLTAYEYYRTITNPR